MLKVVFTERPSKWIQSMGAGLFGMRRAVGVDGPDPDVDGRGADVPRVFPIGSCCGAPWGFEVEGAFRYA